MNILDIILLLCFIPAVISGLRKGFIAQVIAIISLVLGVWLSVKFAVLAGRWLGQWIETSPQLLNGIAFALIFIIVVFALFALGKILEKTIKIIMLGWLNRLLGVLFSVLKCILIVGFLIIVFGAVNGQFHIVSEKYLAESVMYTAFRDIAYSVFPYFKRLIMG